MYPKVGTHAPKRRRRTPRTLTTTLAAAAAAAALLPATAPAQTWSGGAGDWTNPANWIGGLAPNDPTTDVRIDAAPTTASSVTLPYALGFRDIRGLTIDAGDALTNNTYLRAFGPVTVDGTLSILSPGMLSIESPAAVTLGGQGTVNLSGLLFARNGLSISPGLLVQGAGNVGSGLAQFNNYGTIRAGGALELGDHFVNHASVEVVSGGLLRLANQYLGDWKNLGTISVAAKSQLHLGGTFTTADIGTIVRDAGSSVALIGTLKNSGAVLDLDTTTGTLVVRGDHAQIVGGTITASKGAARLEILGNYSGTLDGVTLATDVVLTDNAYLQIRNGLVLQEVTLDLTNGGKLSNWATLAGSGTISGRGEIRLGSYYVNDALVANHVGGFTLGPGILTHGAGWVSVVNDGTIVSDVPDRTLTFRGTNRSSISAVNGGLINFDGSTNLGTIRVGSGSTLTLAGNWHNHGSIRMDDASALVVTGPFATGQLAGLTAAAPITASLKTTVDNTAAVLDPAAVAAGGTLELRGATVRGGTLAATGGARLVIAPPDRNGKPNVLDAVTLATAPSFAQPDMSIEVRNGLTLNALDLSPAPTGGFQGQFAFTGADPQTLGGSGQILLGQFRNDATAPLTLGPGITARGGGWHKGTLANQGTILVENGATFMALDNAATLRVTNASIAYFGTAAALANRGLLRVDAGSTLKMNGSTVTQAAGQLNVNGLLECSSGDLLLAGGTLSGTGKLVTYGNLRNQPSAPVFAAGATVTLSPGATPDGTLSLGTLEMVTLVPLTLTADTRLLIELGPDGASDRLWLSYGDLDLSAGPSLDLLPTADIPLGTTFTVATYQGALTGTFARVTPGFDVDYSTPHQITVTTIPEPASLLPLALTAALATASRRRRRHTSAASPINSPATSFFKSTYPSVGAHP